MLTGQSGSAAQRLHKRESIKFVKQAGPVCQAGQHQAVTAGPHAAAKNPSHTACATPCTSKSSTSEKHRSLATRPQIQTLPPMYPAYVLKFFAVAGVSLRKGPARPACQGTRPDLRPSTSPAAPPICHSRSATALPQTSAHNRLGMGPPGQLDSLAYPITEREGGGRRWCLQLETRHPCQHTHSKMVAARSCRVWQD